MGVVDVVSKSSHALLDWLLIVDAAPLLVLLSCNIAPVLAASIVLAKLVSSVFGTVSV